MGDPPTFQGYTLMRFGQRYGTMSLPSRVAGGMLVFPSPL